MNIWHRRTLQFQIAAITLLLISSFFGGALAPLVFLIPFVMAEIILLEIQRREDPATVRYHKSCIFALLDLASVAWFCVYFVKLAYAELHNFPVRTAPVIWALYLYIICRKYYIMRHYSFED